jgi:hypothetical protein
MDAHAHAHAHVSMHAATGTATRPSCSPRSFDHSRRQSSACGSERSCESLSSQETLDLWRCMLALQERYACYNSRRIDLAMDAGEEAVINLMPNRFIIDTLNDSLIDLPEEGQEMLDRCLRHESNLHDEKPRRKFWKKA